MIEDDGGEVIVGLGGVGIGKEVDDEGFFGLAEGTFVVDGAS